MEVKNVNVLINLKQSNEKHSLQQTRKDHYEELCNHMPYNDKLIWAKEKIIDFLNWCQKENKKEVLVSFSGGKDSTVLLDLVAKVHKEINSEIYLVPAYAIEITFPSTVQFIKSTVEQYQDQYPYIKNPLFVKPIKPWIDILKSKGYPIYSKKISTMLNRLKRSKTKTLLSKIAFGIEPSAKYKISKQRLFLLDSEMTYFIDEQGNRINYFFSEKCCDYVKGGLKHDKRPSFIGTMANESELRKQSWIKNGCNIYNQNHPMSRPLSIWNTNDIWTYIKENKLNINDAYGYQPSKHNINELRFSRLGCTACPLGSSLEEYIANKYSKDDKLCNEYKYRNRFEKLYEYMPNLYESQIWRTGMYNIIADMNIKIRNDEKYMKFYYKRRKRIDEWYQNLGINLIRVMVQIELSDNNSTNWKYTEKEFNKAQEFFKTGHKTNKKEIYEIRIKEKKLKEKYKNEKE